MSMSGLRAVCLALLILPVVSPARAQLIPIKTIPIAQGDQFQIFPPNSLGLGSVSIALADSIGDPFADPATTARLQASRFFTTPTVYSLSVMPAAAGRCRSRCWRDAPAGTAVSRSRCSKSTQVARPSEAGKCSSIPWPTCCRRLERPYPVPICGRMATSTHSV